MSLYISGAYPNFAYWVMSGEGLFMIMLGGVNVFLGPAVGAAILLVLETLVTAHTTHQGIVLGLAILTTALGLKKGLLDFVVEWYRDREGQKDAARTSVLESAEVEPLADAGERATSAGEGRQ
jgi:branched-chain amino acid transport system permease protein